ncbi:Septin-domain-containing protein [Cladochytrium replicatum]|nr:Septin-domain-containing protein [Cladochytrium replicatum]
MPKKQAADDFAQNDQGLTDDQIEAFTPEQRTSYTRFVEVKKSRQARRRTAANLGSLRISICGDSGIGKTSLLLELMRFTEIASMPKMEDPDETVSIDELKCSTISPAELQNGEDPWNLVFIDTPGHGSQLDAMAAIRPILKYHEDQFKRTTGIFTQGLSQPNIVRFVSSGSGGHTHVDACLYCILHRLTPVDIEFMKRLSAFVNVVPVIVKSDSITRDQVFALKVNILLALINNDIPIYGFGLTAEELLALARAKVPGSAPFATYSSEFTSTFGRERNVAPLNDIADLFDVLIYSHTDDLRQLAGEKFVQWRKT